MSIVLFSIKIKNKICSFRQVGSFRIKKFGWLYLVKNKKKLFFNFFKCLSQQEINSSNIQIYMKLIVCSTQLHVYTYVHIHSPTKEFETQRKRDLSTFEIFFFTNTLILLLLFQSKYLICYQTILKKSVQKSKINKRLTDFCVFFVSVCALNFVLFNHNRTEL